jgi:hypothetical protein
MPYLDPYTFAHRSSNAFTMRRDTCPKKDDDTAAWIGLANANARSRVTRVAAESAGCCAAEIPASKIGGADGIAIDWKRQVVVSSLKSGVDDDATAFSNESQDKNRTRVEHTWTDSNGMQVTLLT